jgi:hypothetical protein
LSNRNPVPLALYNVINNGVEIGDCSSVRQAAGYGCKVRILAQSATTPLFAESITISCPTRSVRSRLIFRVHSAIFQPDSETNAWSLRSYFASWSARFTTIAAIRSRRRVETPYVRRFADGPSRVRVFRLRQGNTIMLAKGNPLIDHLPQMPKDFFRIVAMNPAAHEFRALTNIALVFVGPIHQVLVSIAFSHSDNFFRSSFSWYGLASSPSCPETVILFFPSALVKFRCDPFPPRFTQPAFSRSLINSRILRGIFKCKLQRTPRAFKSRCLN